MRQTSHKYPRKLYAIRPILETMTPKRIARFESKIDRSGGDRACHLWRGHTNTTGYGLVQGCDRYEAFSFLAHRIAWALDRQAEPGEGVVRHSCDTPRCCNPRHLLIGDHQDNTRDMIERGRSRFVSTGRPRNRKREAEAWRLRYEERMPVAQIVEALGVHRATVSRWLNGK